MKKYFEFTVRFMLIQTLIWFLLSGCSAIRVTESGKLKVSLPFGPGGEDTKSQKEEQPQ